MEFDAFFAAATGHAPYPYQHRLADGDGGSACVSLLIDIPTGLGKTAAVVLAWLWNRCKSEISDPPSAGGAPPWPRRLVYCLPMRTLVEQTRNNVAEWLTKLAKCWPEKRQLEWLAKHSPVLLMGGEDLEPEKRDWDIWPEQPCILIGTQDMLLSRALNRGYGMSRYRWPMHFGLLNNDCLWVVDETQLMGVGAETSAQLDGFRHQTALAVVGAGCTWWMSATLEEKRLETIDHPKPADGWHVTELEEADLQEKAVKDRFRAPKALSGAGVVLSADTEETTYAHELAQFVRREHASGTLSLVVVNTVARAQNVFKELCKLEEHWDRLALVHSRFRLDDRDKHQAKLLAAGDRIVVATQAVEAGVDVSARLLVTELAPWSSLVQRFGRCNRRGEFKNDEARVFWVDIQIGDNADDLALPYTPDELKTASEALKRLTDAGPQSLRQASAEEPRVVRPVLRRKDLVELFDTTPDLAGHDLDISRYIRDGEDNDVHVFWRDLEDKPPPPELAGPSALELCRVPLARFRQFLKPKEPKLQPRPWVWAPHAEAEPWQQARSARAGAIYLLDVTVGGYSEKLGWTGDPGDTPRPLSADVESGETYSDNRQAFVGRWVGLSEHTRHVCEQTRDLSNLLALDSATALALATAALWHDLGKAHDAFQKMLRGNDASRLGTIWAKSASPNARCERRFFRHELASALAWLQTPPADAIKRDLVAYLIAAHHGRVRLSIRSMPGEQAPPDRPDARIARGVIEGDPLGPVALEDVSLPAIALDLSCMEMGRTAEGQPSWLARMIALRDRFGPFCLAWLETLLRAADARASEGEAAGNQQPSPGVSTLMELRETPPHYGTATSRLSPAEEALVAEIVADGLAIQHKFRPEPLYQQTGKGHYQSDTVEEIRRAKGRKETPEQ
jgi:CRISPR-associated endonuclease/helicase Cas3